MFADGLCKKRFTRLLLLLCLPLFLAIAGCPKPPKTHTPLLRVTFLDVGQGDSTVIEGPTGRVVVVDGGGHPGTDERLGGDPGSRVVVPFLRSRGISAVDLLVPTHPDDDHVQGLNAVVQSLTVRAALEDGCPPDESPPYARLMENLHQRNIPVYLARRGQKIDLGGGAAIEILSPPQYNIPSAHSPTNNRSIVLRVVYGKARFLLTGDAEAEAENDLLAALPPDALAADVLKAGHHGSRGSSTAPFIERVAPAIAVISCGAKNIYGHPNGEVLERFAARNTTVYRTDKQGAIVITTDGNQIRVEPTVP